MKSNPLKWHGGKSYLVPWIQKHYPVPGTYTHSLKPCAGGLATLFADDFDEGVSEAVNDTQLELTGFWKCLQHPEQGPKLVKALSLTPLSQVLFDEDDPNQLLPGQSPEIQSAYMFFIQYRASRQALGKSYVTPTRRVRRMMNEQVSAWLSSVEGLPAAAERLLKVEVRSMDLVQFILAYDHDKAFFYIDPTYLHNDEDGTPVRAATSAYANEMTIEKHIELLELLAKIEGKFLLSGYPSKLYGRFAKKHGWLKVDRKIDNKASSKLSLNEDGEYKKPIKTECLWRNYTETQGD